MHAVGYEKIEALADDEDLHVAVAILDHGECRAKIKYGRNPWHERMGYLWLHKLTPISRLSSSLIRECATFL